MSYVSSLGNLEKNSGMPDSENENKRLMDRPAKRYSSDPQHHHSSQDTEGYEGYEEGHVYSSPYAQHPPYVQHPDEIKVSLNLVIS